MTILSPFQCIVLAAATVLAINEDTTSFVAFLPPPFVHVAAVASFFFFLGIGSAGWYITSEICFCSYHPCWMACACGRGVHYVLILVPLLHIPPPTSVLLFLFLIVFTVIIVFTDTIDIITVLIPIYRTLIMCMSSCSHLRQHNA